MRETSIVGNPINFRGLVYSPVNENGVVFLFGKVIEDLNMYIEEIKPGFPDCVGRRYTGKGRWERVSIEFEYESANFKSHGHDIDGCDMIVCWNHNWPECPIVVMELKEIIQTLPNEPIQPPDIIGPDKVTVEEHLKRFPDEIGSLFGKLDAKIIGISDEVWRKVTRSPGVTYYSPERVFVHVMFRQGKLRLRLFTGGEGLEGVSSIEHKKGGTKWGSMDVVDEKQIENTTSVIEKSYSLIRAAIKNNESTGWFAESEEEDTMEPEDES